MILDLVAVVLGASFAFIHLLRDLVQLLMTLFDVPWVCSAAKMAIQEDERAIFETEPHRDCSLISRRVRGVRLHGGRSHVENTSLHLGLGDQETVQSMLICLSDQGVLAPAGMRVQDCHYVILHESEPVAEVRPP